MESPSSDDRSAALAAAHGLVSLLRAFAAADEGDFQPLHLWSTVNGAGLTVEVRVPMADLPERHRRIIRQRVDEAVAEVASQASEQAGTQITAAVSLINHLVGELARVTSRSHADILESLQNALVDEDNWY